MLLKQYGIPLPADYDMGIIRARVASRGGSFDDFPGLGVKAFMIREKGRFGATQNLYAPFYVWPEIEPMWGFLAGAGFRGIVDSFGRPPVETWLGLAYAREAAKRPLQEMRSVLRSLEPIEPGTDLGLLRDGEIAGAEEAVEDEPDLLLRAVGVDPEKWSLSRFDCYACPQDALPTGVFSYEVLHVSAPSPDL